MVELCRTNQNYKVFADIFSSPALTLKLLSPQIYFVGTLRCNHLAFCQLEDEKSLAKQGRGYVVTMVEKEERMAVVRWYDNKSVTLISSYCAVEPQDKVQSWSKSNRAFVEVSRPDVVKQQIHGRN